MLTIYRISIKYRPFVELQWKFDKSSIFYVFRLTITDFECSFDCFSIKMLFRPFIDFQCDSDIWSIFYEIFSIHIFLILFRPFIDSVWYFNHSSFSNVISGNHWCPTISTISNIWFDINFDHSVIFRSMKFWAIYRYRIEFRSKKTILTNHRFSIKFRPFIDCQWIFMKFRTFIDIK